MSAVTSILVTQPAQLGMLVDTCRDAPGVHVEQLVVSFPAALDGDTLEMAWSWVVEAHEALRSCFVTDATVQPVICVLGRVPARIERATSVPDFDAWLAADRRRGFDLERPPLARLTLAPALALGGGDALVLTYSHLILDGWSVRLLVERLEHAYRRRRDGSPPPPWPIERLSSVRAHLDATEGAARAWLRSHLATVDQLTHPFPDEPPTAVQADAHVEATRVIDIERTHELVVAARRHEASLAMCVQAAWASILLHRTGAPRAVYGVTATMRPAQVEGIEEAIGMLVGTLPVTVAPQASVAALFAELRTLSLHLADAAHADVSGVATGLGWPEGMRLCESVIVTQQGNGRFIDPAGVVMPIGMTACGAHTGYALLILLSGSETLQLRLVGRSHRYDKRRLEGLLEDILSVLFALARAAPGDDPSHLADGLSNERWSAPVIGRARRPMLDAGGTPLRERLREVWEQVMGRPLNPDGRFDWEGTSSLALVVLKARVDELLGTELSLAGWMRHDDLDGLAAWIESEWTSG